MTVNREQEPDEDRRDRENEPLPQLVQMFQEGHPAAGAIAAEFVLVRSRGDGVFVIRVDRTRHGEGAHRPR